MLNKVLCIDDDAVTLMICKMVIAKSSFTKEVVLAENGQIALNILENQSSIPELILLDINMPVMNGWDFLEEFVSKFEGETNSSRVAILSSSVNPEDVQTAGKFAIVIDFIQKPLTTDRLDALKKHEKLKEYFGD